MNSTALIFKLELECCIRKQKDLAKLDRRSSYVQRNIPIALGKGIKQRAGYAQAALLALSGPFRFLFTQARSKP